MELTEGFEEKADAYLAAWTAVNRFSGSVLVAWKDEVIFNRSYGYANREHLVGNSPATKFRLGSITKQFTSAAILMLQEQGKLAVTDRLADYLDDCPGAWEQVTVHHLLNHSSGIPNYTASIQWTAEGRFPLGVQGVIDLFRDRPLEFAPGSRHSYSNSGYHLLGCVIEKASGRTYSEYLQHAIFDPLGMPGSGYDDSSVPLPDRAAGYLVREGQWRNADYIDMSIPYAAGGLYSTTGDLLTWSRSLDSGRLLSGAATLTMESISPLLTTYGYGVQTRVLQGKQFVTHGGGIHGFRTYLLRCPELQTCVAVLANLEQTDSATTAEDLVALMAGEATRTPVTIDETLLEEYAGVYEAAPGIRVTVKAAPPGLEASATGGVERFLLARERDRFVCSADPSQLRFGREGGTVRYLVLEQGGVEQQADRV